AYDPLTKEYSPGYAPEGLYFQEASSYDKNTYLEDNENSNSLKWKTKRLNEVSDYGDALIRFKKHAPMTTYPQIPTNLWTAFVTSSEITTPVRTFLPIEAKMDSLADSAPATNTLAILGDVCEKCGEITVIPIDNFPPLKRAKDYHENNCKITENKALPPSTITNRLGQLVKELKIGIRVTFGNKRYLYCKEILSGAHFLRVIRNREEVENGIWMLGKLAFVRVKTVLDRDYWMVRSRTLGRTELDEEEMTIFLSNAQSTCAVFWGSLDCSPAHYLMWIDEEKPRLKTQVNEILQILRSRPGY
ncbi:MAG TPA: hypothetical protein VF884_06070, partial [Nitrososphaeraceae archaeon]